MTAPDILQLQLPPQDEADLVWLFGQSESDLGLHSNLGPQLDKIRISAGQNRGTKGGRMVNSAASKDTDRMIAAAERYRRISAIMSKVPASHQRVLMAYYGAATYCSKEQRQKYKAYGAYCGVVLVLSNRATLIAGRSQLDSDNTDHLRNGAAGTDARQRVAARLAAAKKAVVAACHAYRDAKRSLSGAV